MSAFHQQLPARSAFRVSIVLPLEFHFARGIAEGIRMAVAPHNMEARVRLAAHSTPPRDLPWIFFLHSSDYDDEKMDSLFRGIKGCQPDAVICLLRSRRLFAFLTDLKKPFVQVMSDGNYSHIPSIDADNETIGTLGAKHFIERGLRNVAFVSGSQFWSQARERGFRQVAQENGLRYFPVNVAPEIAPETSGHFEKLAATLADLPRPIGVMAACDRWGLMVAQVALEQGIAIPEEMALVGVDNDRLMCDMCNPPLSSVDQNLHAIGQAAVRSLMEIVRHGCPRLMHRVVPPAGLVGRHSSELLAISDEKVAQAMRLIQRDIRSGLNVKTLAAAVGLSRRTLQRRFLSVIGRSPNDEIRRVRIETAVRLLQTQMPIATIAATTGFSSSQHMARVFLKEFNVRPSELREKLIRAAGEAPAQRAADPAELH